MNPRFVWPVVTLVGVAMVVAGTMASMRVDRETIILIMSLLVSPVLTAMLAVQVAEVRATTSNVERQTNGNVTRLMDLLDVQARLLAASTPTATPASTSPERLSSAGEE